jgi:hypothetical protein
MKHKILFGIFFIVLFLGVVSGASLFEGGTKFSGGGSFASSVTHQNRPSFQAIYGPEDRFRTYWPILGDRETCEARQDLILQVAPLGCQPSVVRSDLLADQNVPVFCQIDALQVNPLIDIKQIRNIRFTGDYPDEIIGAGFHPARAALRTRDKLLGDPLINNIGYVAVVLKKNEIEKDLPDSVNVTLTARLDFEAGNAYGIGRAEFLLNKVSDIEWDREKKKQSFWNGRYFVRLDDADSEFAVVSLYFGDRKISTMKVQKGKTSGPVYVPGAFCRAGLEVSYTGFVAARKKAKIEIGDKEGSDVIDLYEGTSFLNNKCRVNGIGIESRGFGNVSIRCNSREEILIGVSPAVNSTEGVLVDEPLDKEAEEKYNEALRGYEIIVEDYPAERAVTQEGGRIYAEEALSGAIELTRAVEVETGKKKRKTMQLLLNKYVELFPDGSNKRYEEELREIFSVDVSRSGHVIEIDNRFYTIRLLDLVPPMRNSSASVRIVGKRAYNIEEEQERGIDGDVIKKIRMDRIVDVETVEVTPVCFEGSGDARGEKKGKSILLRTGDEPVDICGTEKIQLDSVNFEETVRIMINPVSQGTRIETNLSVNIGIEKRAIKLSPEKTLETIENLNESIAKWEKINEGLGKLVTGLRGACFATAGVLTVKNFFEGVGGVALAREQVMGGENGWKQKCKDAIDLKQIDRGDGGGTAGVDYRSMTECFNAEKVSIEKEIEARAKVNGAVNALISRIEGTGDIKTGDTLSGYAVDESRAMGLYVEELKKEFSGDELVDILEPEKGGVVPYTYKDLREIHTQLLLKKEGISSQTVEKNYQALKERVEGNINLLKKYQTGAAGGGLVASFRTNIKDSAVNKEARFIVLDDEKDKFTGVAIPAGNTHGVIVEGYTGQEGGTSTGGGEFLIVGQKQGGELSASEIYKVSEEGDKIKLSAPEGNLDLGNFLSYNNVKSFEDVGTDLVGHTISVNNRKVRFFEIGPDKGLPAIVPFDVLNGWYARVDSSLKIGNQLASYDKSGLPRTWKICNVGENGAIDLKDKCQLVQQGYSGRILGLELRQSQRLMQDSQEALLDAASQYGESVIRIGREEFYQGAPVTPFDQVECQDYMGIDDCKLLFNVCDPVICPASRCDFGGEFPVADVIQSGIVGSALLCLPNYRDGIVAPVCLSGIHAGIEGYVSVMKNYQSCLQESLDTGRLVGMCDYIHSVYLCDFFWRQAAPIAGVVLPKAVELATGKASAVHGGGEYLDVQKAWKNAGDSADYFTQSYAVNSLKAFNLRDTAEVGTQFCKAFVTAKGPKSFESLIEPESPPQFHAWFSSTSFTDVTVPPTAQYKVFYHIFAGNDVGVQFQVYLKNPPESSFYFSNPTVLISSGFVGRGQFATDTRELTLPEGYKELCVRVNDQEECGFKQVSTSFALDYLNDQFTSEKITQSDIKSEVECVSGGISPANLGSLINPNIQAGAEEVVFPMDYNRGIVRVCASDSPGGKTEPNRYVDVGHCGEASLRCWLDKRSVDGAISDSNRGVLDETLSDLENIQRTKLEEDGGIFRDEEAVGEIKDYGEDVNAEIEELEGKRELSSEDTGKVSALLTRSQGIFGKLFLNHRKAELLLFEAKLRDAVARIFVNKLAALREDRGGGDVEEVEEVEEEVEEEDLFSLQAEYNPEMPEENHLLLNGAQTEMYISLNDLYFEVGSSIGRITADNRIFIGSQHEAKVNAALEGDENYFDLLNGALVTGDEIELTE